MPSRSSSPACTRRRPTATVPLEKRLRAAVGNLGVYAVCLGVVPDAKDRAAVVALMRATFPMLRREEIARAVGITP